MFILVELIYFIIIVIICFSLNNKFILFTKRTNNSLQIFKDFVSNVNDNTEINNDKLAHLQSYVTDLERKIITIKTNIEIMKSKKNIANESIKRKNKT